MDQSKDFNQELLYHYLCYQDRFTNQILELCIDEVEELKDEDTNLAVNYASLLRESAEVASKKKFLEYKFAKLTSNNFTPFKGDIPLTSAIEQLKQQTDIIGMRHVPPSKIEIMGQNENLNIPALYVPLAHSIIHVFHHKVDGTTISSQHVDCSFKSKSVVLTAKNHKDLGYLNTKLHALSDVHTYDMKFELFFLKLCKEQFGLKLTVKQKENELEVILKLAD